MTGIATRLAIREATRDQIRTDKSMIFHFPGDGVTTKWALKDCSIRPPNTPGVVSRYSNTPERLGHYETCRYLPARRTGA
jgi:hypothetical protein